MRGHGWCKDCAESRKRDVTFDVDGTPTNVTGPELPAVPTCTASVEPDMLKIGGRHFKLDGMTKYQKVRLYKFMGGRMGILSIPEEFDAFETADPDAERWD